MNCIYTGIRSTIATEFMEGLKDLFTEHYIDVPEDKVDVAEELAAKVDEYEASLNSQIEENIELKKQLQGHVATVIVSDIAESLTDTEADKLTSLTEGLEFVSEDDYRRKVETIKESYFTGKSSDTGVTAEFGLAYSLAPSNVSSWYLPDLHVSVFQVFSCVPNMSPPANFHV